jgi:predicted TIM-barrel fold metal-dependent hydrolase
MLIDVHAHIGRICKELREYKDATSVVNQLDDWGIDKACVMGLSEHPEAEYQDSDTKDVLHACLEYPTRLIPFCLIDPRFGANAPTMDFTYLLEQYKACWCRGIGEFLPKMEFDDPRCLNLYKQAGKFGMPILFDMNSNPTYYGLTDKDGLPRLEHALKVCPKTVFIGHGPSFWAQISGDVPAKYLWGYPPGPVKKGGAVPRLMAKYDNLWADLSAGSGHNAITRDPKFGLEFLDRFQDKLMFGTDSCRRSDTIKTVPIVPFFQRLREERRVSKSAYEKLSHRNAERLLHILPGASLL